MVLILLFLAFLGVCAYLGYMLNSGPGQSSGKSGSHTWSGSDGDYSHSLRYYDDADDSLEDDHDMTRDYYGMHGEFDINDESRRVSEDMQGFHDNYPDSDLSDHYYWDDVVDAETDGYLEDD